MSIVIKLNKYSIGKVMPDVWHKDGLVITPDKHIGWTDIITADSGLAGYDPDYQGEIQYLNEHPLLYQPKGWLASNDIYSNENTIIQPSHSLVTFIGEIYFPAGAGFPAWTQPSDKCFTTYFGGSRIGFKSGAVGEYPESQNHNFNLCLYDGTDEYWLPVGYNILDEGFFIVAYTWDNVSKEACLYIGSQKYSGTFSNFNPSGNGTLYLNTGSNGTHWGGHFGESRIWNKVLTDSQINAECRYFANKYGLAWSDV